MQTRSDILDWIDSEAPDMLNMLEEWSAINTGSENTLGLSVFLKVIKSHFQRLGGTIVEAGLPPRDVIAADGKPAAIQQGKILSIIKRPEAPFRVLFSGHMDTVYPSSSAFQKTERLDNNVLRGPGVADMKGGLIVMLKSIEAFEQHPLAQQIGWEVLINPDEEVGSIASEPWLRASARRSTIGLVFEPSFSDGAMVSMRKGSANLTLIAHGRSAHAGRDYNQGRNAIIALARALEAIHSMNRNEKGITINVGCISGGGPVNIVPDLAIGKLNIRTVQSGDFGNIYAQIQAIVDSFKEEGIALELHLDHARPPKIFEEKSRKIFDLLNSCANEEGYGLSVRPSGGACDSNIFAEEGLPVMDALGVIGGNIHTAQEYALIDSLASRARLVCLFLLKIANEGIFHLSSQNPLEDRRHDIS